MAFVLTNFHMNLNINEQKQITLFILFLSIIGLVAIYYSVINIKPTELKIESIEDSMIDRIVKISGRIDNIRKSKTGNFYWTVNDGTNITVPILDGKFKKLEVKRGDSVEIVGLVTKYNEELEVMPKEIYIR